MEELLLPYISRPWRRLFLRLEALRRIDQRLHGLTMEMVSRARLRRVSPGCLWNYSKTELRELLIDHGISPRGSKGELVRRLHKYTSLDWPPQW